MSTRTQSETAARAKAPGRPAKPLKIDLSVFNNLPDNACVTPKELAEMLNISTRQLYLLTKQNKIPKPFGTRSVATNFTLRIGSERPRWKLGELRVWQKQLLAVDITTNTNAIPQTDETVG